MPMKRTAFAARRKAVGLSQEGLAERLRVDRSTVVRWENGESSPQPGMRPRLARAFHVSVDQLDDLLTPGGPVEPEAMQPFAGQARSLKISAQASPGVSSTAFGDADYLQSVHSHIREIVALDNRKYSEVL